MSTASAYRLAAEDAPQLLSPTLPTSTTLRQEDGEEAARVPSFATQLPRRLAAASVTTTVHTSRAPVRADAVSTSQPSVFELLTALPLLLSLDSSEYEARLDPATLSQYASAATGTRTRPLAGQLQQSRSAASRKLRAPSDGYGDAATTAVRAVLYSCGPSGTTVSATRRRLRRVALDAFFDRSLSSRISSRMVPLRSTERGGSAAAATDGVREATERLLAHTRAVMADVSPTQAHLVDLFAGQILVAGQAGGRGRNVTASPAIEAPPSAASIVSPSSGGGGGGDRGGPSQPVDGARGILKPSSGAPASQNARAATAHADADASSLPSPTSSIAVRLLYVILRTSIAANTPLRHEVRANGIVTANEETQAFAAPADRVHHDGGVYLPPSPTTTASSTGSLLHKKARLDVNDSSCSPSMLFSLTDAESIRCHPGITTASTAAAARQHDGTSGNRRSNIGTAVLPYEPQCWLGPSTIALVEQSAALRRQQRWGCDGDPVIEAAIAGKGEADAFYNRAFAWGSGEGGAGVSYGSNSTTSAAAALTVFGRRNHWLPQSTFAAGVSRDDAVTSLLSEGALPFDAEATYKAGAAAPYGAARSITATRTPQTIAPLGVDSGPTRGGKLHWGLDNNEDGETDPTVAALFSEAAEPPQAGVPCSADRALSSSKDVGGAASSASGSSSPTRAEKTRKSARASAPSPPPLALPLCRTPFVLCSTLYDPVLYAHVHVALHRCTAGLIDPYELTCYTTDGGPNMVAIRVRPELYDTARKHSRLHAHSGLTAMLEWGCACGTLLLRLHRLCEVADGAAQRAILGSYGRCVVDTLRVLLFLLQRQMDELGHRVGGPHRLTFAELLTAQQRLQGAVEQVHLLATFFSVPGVSAAADREDTSRIRSATAAGTPRRRSGKSVPPPAWDPAAALQESCCSARVLSRLHALFTARHTDALGRHGSTAAAYSQLQHDALEERLSTGQAEGGETGREGVSSAQMRAATAPLLSDAISSPLQHSLRWEQQRKDLLSHAMDACGLLLRAALRPLHTMLHRWLTTGEVVDPYDEFFIVPSHGITHGGGGSSSGLTIDFSPQRLPSFISPAAARDLLQAGISLRVLRAAATHVVRSAQKDVRRLQGLAEVTEGAAEDFAEELRDTQTLQTAIERFVERLVRGAPTVHGEQRLGGVDVWHDGSQAEGEGAAGAVAMGDAPLPLPPCVDVLSAYGAIEWWRQHYQACTEVLLEAVEDAAAAPSSDADKDARREDEGEEFYDDDANNEEEEERERNGVGAVPAVAEVESAAQTTASISATVPADTEAVNEESGAVMVAATTAVAAADTSAAVLPGPPRHLVYPPSLDPTASATMGAAGAAPSPRPPPSVESDQESQPYITVFMNSEDDEDERGNGLRQHGQQQGIHQADRDDSGSERGASSSSSSPSAASSAASSVLGLRRLAGSEFSTGTTVSSTASSRGTIALYGAIAEELRQVALLEQRTEERVDASRHALRAEFDTQMWRRRREARLAEWRAQRLALRLLRLRAMENMAEELRDVYGIRGVGRDEEAAPPRAAPSADEQRRLHNEEKETEGGGGGGDDNDGAVTEQTELSGVVVRLSHYPPARAAPPVLLYADDTVDDKGGPGHSRRMRHSRRTSFAASATMMEWEPSERRSQRRGSSAISSGGSVDAVSRRASYSHSAQQLQQQPSLLLPPSPHRPARLRSASGPTLLPSVYGREGVSLHARRLSQDAASTTLAARTRSPVAWPRSVARSRSSPAGTHAFADPQIAATSEGGGGGGVDSLSSAAPGAARSLPASPSQWARAGGAVRQLRDVAPSALASLGSGARRMSAVTFAEDAGGVAPASMPPPHEDHHQQQQQQRLTQQDVSGSLVRHTQQKTTSPTLHEEEEELSLPQGSPRHGLGSSVANSLEATQSREGGGGRRDELGYEHPDAHYVVADINDDEFLWMRTGPRSYARREAEQAALARLATRQEELNRCTVDAPAYLEELRQRTAALLGARETGREAGESYAFAAAAAAAAELPHTQRVDGDAEEDNVEPPAPEAKHKNAHTPPLVLSALWSADDPLGGVGHTSLPSTCRHGTEQLWSWTPAEAHRWYFDRRVPPLHRVLVGSAVDDALLLDTPLTTDEAAALQQCSGYYRALGQYTASFLTHKALQLTLLPPYGTLYRLTTQFLDVCLLQKAPAAVRIIDSWVGAVDAALEMMAEQEAEELLRAAIAGEESVPAPLTSLTDRQRGMDVPATLAVLNGAFQREWAAAVEGGETTVKLAWTVVAGRRSRGSATAANHRASATAAAEEDGQEEEEGEDGLLGVDRRDRYGAASAVPSPHLAWHHQGADDMDLLAEEEEGENAEGGRRRASVPLAAASDDTAHASIQFFLSHLELAAVSPWCSGAWLLPERTTQCTGAIFRTLLFWKSVDRLVLHTWRAGMESGLSTVFFFCTTVRQVLLSTLHEQVWAQLTELTAAYRESLRFEAGVLYTYRALESFTRDHETFLDDCEFYALCSAPFKRRVQPLLQAMTRQVEVAERALRFAQVSTRVARRQYMATYRSMVGDGDDEEGSDEGHSSRSSSRSSSGGCDKGRRPGRERSRRRATGAPLTPRVRKAAGKTSTPTASSAAAASGPVVRLPHVFTPSRWSRGVGQRSATAADTHDSNVSESGGRSAQATPAQQLTAPSLAQHADAPLSLLKHGAETSQPASKKQSGAAAGVRRTASQRAGKTPTRSGGATPRTGKGVTVLKTQSTSVSTTRSISPAIGTGGHKHGDRSASAVSVATTSTAATASSVAAAVLHAEGGERGESVAAESSLARSSSRGGHSDDESSASHSDSSSGSDGHSGDDGEQTQSTRSLRDPTTAEAAEINPLSEKAKKKKKKTAKGKRRRPTQAPAKDAPPRRSIMESATMNTTPIYAAVLAAQEQQRQQQQLQLRQQLAHWTGTAQKRSRSSTAGGSGGIRGRPSPTPLHATVLLHQAAADDDATASAASGTTMAAAVSPASSLAHWLTPKQAGRRPRRQQQQRQRTGPRLSSVERRERRAKLRAIAERKIEEETLHQRRRVRDVIAGRLRRFATLTESLRDALSAVIAEEDAAAQRRREAADGAQAEHEAQQKLRGRFAYLSSMIRRLDALIEVMASQV